MRLALNILLALALVAFTTEQLLAPNSWWIDIHKIYIPDSSATGPVSILAIDGTVRQSFIANYDIDIRRVGEPSDLTHFTYFCSGAGELSLRPGAAVAPNVDLNWWTKGVCPKFSEGSYYAHMILRWRDFLTNRSLSIDSNVWIVTLPQPPPEVVVERPITQVTKQVTKTIHTPPRLIIRERCEPSLIPPRDCAPRRRSRGNRGR